jgi:DNA (cytosine-5)-methyltransferase 1
MGDFLSNLSKEAILDDGTLKMWITGDSGVRAMIKIIELFSGIGAQVAALKRLGIPYEVVGISEIDKYAIQSYEAINGYTYNYGDITKIPMLDYADLWTYSFPCQDLSVAGKQAGINEGTRSGLLLHVERLLETAVMLGNQPKYLVLENVKALIGKKFKPDFERWLNKLDSLGYNNYWQVLNAKDYGVPQNRERVFVVSIRKDVDTKGYTFPSPVPLTRRLKDVLEPQVDEKYYLHERYLQYIKNKEGKNYNFRVEISNVNDIRKTPLRRRGDYAMVGEPLAYDEQNKRIRNDGCVGTLTTDGSSPKHNNRIIEENINLYPNSGNPQAGRVYNAQGISPSLDTCQGGNRMPKITENYRIRKLTPLECWRLMDFTDEEFYAAQLSGVSNSQLYKQSGNSICVCVLQAIFKELLS